MAYRRGSDIYNRRGRSFNAPLLFICKSSWRGINDEQGGVLRVCQSSLCWPADELTTLSEQERTISATRSPKRLQISEGVRPKLEIHIILQSLGKPQPSVPTNLPAN